MPRGFTLVELLVVITIVVVLLALLAPALDRAVYEASLAVCGSTQGQAVRAFVTYTSDNRRLFPYRPTQQRVTNAAGNIGLRRRPHVIKDVLSTGSAALPTTERVDDRPYLRAAGAGSLSLLRDPMCPKVDWDNIGPDAIGYANYALWFGFKCDGPKGGRAILRLGDSLQWLDDSHGGTTKLEFRVLVSDWDMPSPRADAATGTAQRVIVSHPDDGGRLVAQRFQDAANVTSFWAGISPGDSRRPPVDLNFGVADGSVQRYNDVAWNDTRMARLPYDGWPNNWDATEDLSVWNHLPRNP